MKFYVDPKSDLAALASHFVLEGHEFVEKTQAEFVVPQPVPLTKEICRSLLLDCPDNWPSSNKLSVVSWFDGVEFCDYHALQISLIGLMNHNLGPQATVATLTVPCEQTTWWRANLEKLRPSLTDSKYRGVITLGVSPSILVTFGSTDYGIYPMLEGVRGSKLGQIVSPTNLFSSVAIGVLVSLPHFPSETLYCKPEAIKTPDTRHFWLYPCKSFGKTIHDYSPRLGIATAWSARGLKDVCARVLRTCKSIEHPEKQYRTDLYARFSETLEHLQSLGIKPTVSI